MIQSFATFQDFKRRYPIRPNDTESLLGSGTYGRVIKVEDQVETEWVAIKISEYKGNDSKSLKAEVELAQRVPRQANIARYDACYRLETDTSVSDFAIMKYYPDGNLADLLRNRTLTATQVYDITRGILLGLRHLHQHRIVHRDFKPANILISRNNTEQFIPKIADFGLSKLVADEELDSSDFDLSDGRGTPSYKAPEQIEGSRVSFNLDLWAFGVILYEIMTGEKPFQSDLRNSSEQSVRRAIEKKIITVELPDRINQIEEPYRAIIRRCLIRDIHARARKEDELLDLLDRIEERMLEANRLADQQAYSAAIGLFEQILADREHHLGAQKGVDRCRMALQQQQLAAWLAEADRLLGQQQPEQAKKQYEQILRLAPTHEGAIQGLTTCIEQLKPKPAPLESAKIDDVTDVFQEELTDVYPVLTAPVAAPTGLPSKEKQLSLKQSASVTNPVVSPPVSASIRRAWPWRVVVPAALGLGAIVWSISAYRKSTPLDNVQPATEIHAGVGPSATPKAKTDSESATKLPVIPSGDAAETLRKRVDKALVKAQHYFQQENYAEVLKFTNSALQLDPTRRDVLALRDAAAKRTPTTPVETDRPTAVVTPTPVPATTNPVKPEESKPTEVSNADEVVRKRKQEQQDKYELLIEEGLRAINKGNNKAKAIADFSSAHALAKAQDLNTTKAEIAYATYLGKANRIFDSASDDDSYNDAKAWYQVAQALKDTDEVRRKIKQCH